MPENRVESIRIKVEGMTRADLARAAGLDPNTLARIENGGSCRVDTAKKIVEALGFKWEEERQKVFPDGWG